MKQFTFYAKDLEAKSFYDKDEGRQRYFVKGHISTSDLDLVNDIVTKNCMNDMDSQIKSKSVKLDFEHETLRAGKDESESSSKFNLTRIPLGKSVDSNLDEKGNQVEFELNPDWKKFDSKGNIVMTFEDVWANVKNKYYDGFSIAYIPVKTSYKSMNGDDVRLLDKVNLINVALTGNPINPSATMNEVFAKSLDYLKEKGEGKAYDDYCTFYISEADNGWIVTKYSEDEDEKVVVGSLEEAASVMRDIHSEMEIDSSDGYEGASDGYTRRGGQDFKNRRKKKYKKYDEKGDSMNKTDEGKGQNVSGSQTPEGKGQNVSEDNNDSGKAGDNSGAEVKGDTELKSMVAELKSQIEELKGSVDKVENLESEVKGINETLESAVPKGKGAESKSQMDAQRNESVGEVKSGNTLDLI